MSPAIGAAITGIDLRAPLDDDTFAAVHDAFLASCVLVFPEQHLGPAEQQAFGERFGEPLVVPYLAPHALPGYPAILRVDEHGQGADADRELALRLRLLRGAAADRHPRRPAASRVRRRHDVGQRLRRVRRVVGADARRCCPDCGRPSPGSVVDDDGQRRDVVTYHPVVRTHPLTNRQALAIGRIESVPHFEGMTEAESRPLLQFLYEHCTRPEFVYRHRWGQGDVVMWDNRCTLHYAIHDYGDTAERLMHRITILGEQCT